MNFPISLRHSKHFPKDIRWRIMQMRENQNTRPNRNEIFLLFSLGNGWRLAAVSKRQRQIFTAYIIHSPPHWINSDETPGIISWLTIPGKGLSFPENSFRLNIYLCFRVQNVLHRMLWYRGWLKSLRNRLFWWRKGWQVNRTNRMVECDNRGMATEPSCLVIRLLKKSERAISSIIRCRDDNEPSMRSQEWRSLGPKETTEPAAYQSHIHNLFPA